MGGHADREFEEPVSSDDEPSVDGLTFLAEPGWYTIDYKRNVQAFWDGSMWSRTRRWRGVGWFEDDPSSLLAPVVSADVAAQYGPRSVVNPGTGPWRHPPSLVRIGEDRRRALDFDFDSAASAAAPRPRFNGMAVASFVLSLLGLLGVGSVLGIIYGFRARRDMRWSREAQRGDRLALAGIILGFCTLVLFLVALVVGFIALSGWTSRVTSKIDASAAAAVGEPAALSAQTQLAAVQQCQADLRTVDVAVTAYWMDMGAYPKPAARWSPATYASNYARLTSRVDGGPWLQRAPSSGAYVVEYDAAGHVWVAPAGTYEASFVPSQGLDANPDACRVAVG